ncbi:MAG: tRNA dihydrouridine synthase DusB [Thermodesulfovibrionales bacterium]
MLKIGTQPIDSPFILAPLAGISDLPYRMLNRRFGCRFAFTEMISASSILYGSRRTRKMIADDPRDRPLGLQLLARDPDDVSRALEFIDPASFNIIDLNAACPVPKIVAKGQGAALMKDRQRLTAILERLVRTVDLPVTVKIRTGWDDASVNAVEIARAAQDAGAAAVFIHGRTRKQGYGGEVDYRTVGDVKKALAVPVIGSGDILSARLASRMFAETGCDGVTVARGALGNPWIFREFEHFRAHGTEPARPTASEIADVMIEHLNANAAFHGEKVGTMLFRKFFVWYSRGFSGLKRIREEAFSAETRGAMSSLIERLRQSERAGAGGEDTEPAASGVRALP